MFSVLHISILISLEVVPNLNSIDSDINPRSQCYKPSVLNNMFTTEQIIPRTTAQPGRKYMAHTATKPNSQLIGLTNVTLPILASPLSTKIKIIKNQINSKKDFGLVSFTVY